MSTTTTTITVRTDEDLDVLDTALTAAQPGTVMHVAQYAAEDGSFFDQASFAFVEEEQWPWRFGRVLLWRRAKVVRAWRNTEDARDWTVREMLLHVEEDLDGSIVSVCTIIAADARIPVEVA